MRLRIHAVLIVVVLTPFTLSPANAAINGALVSETKADDQGRFSSKRFSGTVWVDENADGIRQPSEPVAANSYLFIQGSYDPTNRHWEIYASYFKSGAKPVRKSGGAVSVDYTHTGSAFHRFPPGENHQTLSIRVVQHGQHHLSPLNLPLADGHFFKETSEERFQRKDAGFAVTNADGIPFWDTWQRLGLENVGYPISHRYMWRGFVTQAFQKAIMQWQPGKGVFFVNIFDEMHDAGRDDVLRSHYATPHQLEDSFDASLSVEHREEIPESVQNDLQEMHWESIKERRLALLDANPAIKERYYAAPDPLLLYGLPTSRVEDMGNHYAIRTQRTVFQQWKEDVPWAKAGEVTIANGGDIVKGQNTTCEPSHSGGENCTHLFFPGRFYSYHGPIALTPQHISLFDVEDRKSFPEAAILPQPAGFVGARSP